MCTVGPKTLCTFLECKKCINKSFASHPKSLFWSEKNKLTPRQIFKKSNKKFWFECNDCKHSFCSVIYSVTSDKEHWCPYCSNQKLCINEECWICFDKSFASHSKVEFWSDQNELSPRETFKNSNKKFWFNCNICENPYLTRVNRITKGHGCPNCINKTELKVFKFLKKYYPEIENEKYFEWCKNKRYLPFDFIINKIIIELDGDHHFKQVGKWKSPEYTVYWDNYKMKKAQEHGYSVIRLYQQSVWKDLYDWKKFLLKAINFLKDIEFPTIIVSPDDKHLYKNHNIN